MEQYLTWTTSMFSTFTVSTDINWKICTVSSKSTAKLDENEEIVRMIQVIGRPPIIILGTFGNILTFIAMQRGSLKNLSTCFYMAILALADTGALWAGGFSFWMKYLTRGKIHPDTWTDCKVGKGLFHFCSQYSSSLLMIMSIEKCFALYFPLKTKSICTVGTAKKISLGTAIVLSAFNAQFVYIYGVKSDSNGKKSCTWVHISETYKEIYLQIDAVLYSFLPLIVMCIVNCLLVSKFMLAKWRNRRGGSESVNQALSKSAVKGSVMLLSISFSFIVLTAPICYASITSDAPNMVYGITVILQYLNHSINGLLYCITGSRFRQELKGLFSCCFTKRTVTSNTMSTVTSYFSSTGSPT